MVDQKLPPKLEGKFYRTAIRPVILYGTICWAAKKQHVTKMSVADMRMLGWMCGKIRKDRIRNTNIRDIVRVALIKNKFKRE